MACSCSTSSSAAAWKPSNRREYGPADLFPAASVGLYEGVSACSQVWMSHSDTVKVLPEGAKVIASNQHGTPVSLQWDELFFGIQFHPEVTHSHEGLRILHNFLSHAGEPAALPSSMISNAR